MQQYIGDSFDAMSDDDTTSVSVSLVGSHLQNISIEVENGAVDLSFIMSPSGARKMITTLEAALTELKRAQPET